jgi:hypothetical protein
LSAWTTPPLRSPTHCDTQVDHSYYGRVRQRPRIGTQPLADSATWSSPSHPEPPGVVSVPPSHVPYESQGRAHAACTPDPTWAVNGYPPGSSRDKPTASVSESPKHLSTRRRQRAHAHRSSSRPTPDAITAAPFPTTLSTTVFSLRTSRRFDVFPRRTTSEVQNLLHLLVQHRIQQTCHRFLGLPPAFVFTTGFDAISRCFGAFATHALPCTSLDKTPLERLPDPHLTHHVRLFPVRFPRRSSANAVPGWFDASPHRATPEGQQSPISRTAPLPEDLPTTTFLQRS